MNKKLMLTTIASIIFILVLSACGASTDEVSSDVGNNESSSVESSSNDAPSEVDTGSGIGEDFRDAMSISSQLGFGTLLLEDSEYAVDGEQAAQLLPLWKAARSLSESETAAEAELEAVFNQIEDTMTSEQLSAISEMQLTGEEMTQLMEDFNLSFGFGGAGFENLTPEQQATAQAARESGESVPGSGFAGGGLLGGGRGQGQGGQGVEIGNLTPEQQATAEARRAERGGIGARFALVFVDPLIELLEERVAE